MTDRRRTLGQRGEQAACDYLLRCGWTLLARNWRCPPYGELDLVLREGETVVVVEVRARRAGLDVAFASVDPRKQTRLARMTEAFLAAHELDDAPSRVDVIAVTFDASGEHGTLRHARDVLGWD